MAADDTSALEVASWIAAIFPLLILLIAGIPYHFGRIRPLVVSGHYDIRQHEDGATAVEVSGSIRSRTRNTQIVRSIHIGEPPAPVVENAEASMKPEGRSAG
jgi:hypothetical protein